uniref:Uncharacterized protein n=3 Tax=Oryza TaxID=4527 RepID=A0A0D3HVQ4_9ORYZ
MITGVQNVHLDQEERSADLIEKIDTVYCKTESHRSLTEERRPVLSEEQNTVDRIDFGTNKLSSPHRIFEYTKRNKSVSKIGTDTVSKDHPKNLVPFTEECLAVMEAFGEVSLLDIIDF